MNLALQAASIASSVLSGFRACIIGATMRIFVPIAFVLFVSAAAAAAEPPVVYLWPGGAPGSEGKTGDEKVQVQAAGDHVISNVRLAANLRSQSSCLRKRRRRALES